MKKYRSATYWFLSILVIVSLQACGAGAVDSAPTPNESIKPESTATYTPEPTSTATTVPTATITLTPTSTPQSVMVSQTPVALNKITAENASHLELLTKLDTDTQTDILAFSMDGNSLAAGLAKEAFWQELLGSNRIQIWDISEGQVAHTVDIPGTLTSLAYQDEFLKIATCTNGVWYGCLGSEILQWQASDQTLVSKAGVKGLVYVFPPKDMPTVLHLSTTTYDNYQLWDLQSGNFAKLYDISKSLEWDASMGYSSDGEHFAIGIGTVLKLYKTDSDQPVILEDPNETNKNRYTAIVFSPDGTTIASGNGGGNIKLWQASDGSVVRDLNGHTGAIDTLAFSADGTMLVSIAADNSLRVWNVSDGTSIFTTSGVCAGRGYKAARCYVAFSPTGTLIASIGWPDKNIFLWGIK
jgi:WD40 repeat protein